LRVAIEHGLWQRLLAFSQARTNTLSATTERFSALEKLLAAANKEHEAQIAAFQSEVTTLQVSPVTTLFTAWSVYGLHRAGLLLKHLFHARH
jgi:hypothetical protein